MCSDVVKHCRITRSYTLSFTFIPFLCVCVYARVRARACARARVCYGERVSTKQWRICSLSAHNSFRHIIIFPVLESTHFIRTQNYSCRTLKLLVFLNKNCSSFALKTFCILVHEFVSLFISFINYCLHFGNTYVLNKNIPLIKKFRPQCLKYFHFLYDKFSKIKTVYNDKRCAPQLSKKKFIYVSLF